MIPGCRGPGNKPGTVPWGRGAVPSPVCCCVNNSTVPGRVGSKRGILSGRILEAPRSVSSGLVNNYCLCTRRFILKQGVLWLKGEKMLDHLQVTRQLGWEAVKTGAARRVSGNSPQGPGGVAPGRGWTPGGVCARVPGAGPEAKSGLSSTCSRSQQLPCRPGQRRRNSILFRRQGRRRPEAWGQCWDTETLPGLPQTSSACRPGVIM